MKREQLPSSGFVATPLVISRKASESHGEIRADDARGNDANTQRVFMGYSYCTIVFDDRTSVLKGWLGGRSGLLAYCELDRAFTDCFPCLQYAPGMYRQLEA